MQMRHSVSELDQNQLDADSIRLILVCFWHIMASLQYDNSACLKK